MPALLRYRSLVALAEAWPFRAPDAFEHALVSLDRKGLLDGSGPSGSLARSFELEARLLARGHSLATLTVIRDSCWFTEPDGAHHWGGSLVTLLQHVAHRYLCNQGNHVRLQKDMDHAGGGLAWRQLTLQLPQDLLLAGFAAGAGKLEPVSAQVCLGHAGLERMLDKPVAETHLHVGAALDFAEVWAALMRELTKPKLDTKRFEPPFPFVSGEDYLRTLSAAALVRLLLVAFVWQLELHGCRAKTKFAEFLTGGLTEIAERCGSGLRSTLVHRACLDALSILRTGLAAPLSCSGVELRHAHRLLWGPRRRFGYDRELITDTDPILAWQPRLPGRVPPELRFMTRALIHLSRAPSDLGFARAFWQYVRVRNLCYGHLVERPGTGGLDWFTRHYDRLSPHRAGDSKRTTARALELESRGLRLASLEVRTAPPSRWYEVRQLIRSVAKQGQAHTSGLTDVRPELGLVLHFIKARIHRRGRHNQLHATPGGTFIHHRYGHWFTDCWRRAGAIERALDVQPELLLVLRGQDVAAHELAIPNWPLVPLFERVRQASERASRQLARRRPDWRVPPLRTTIHVGEEFRRPSDGLRRVHECIEFGLLRHGDRVGHGLVLGWPMERWCNQNAVVMQPREDRLSDLLWEFERYTKGELRTDATRLAFVRAQIYKLGSQIFGGELSGRPPSVEELVHLRRRLFDSSWLLGGLGYPRGRERSQHDGDVLATLGLAYLCKPQVYSRATTSVPVAVDKLEREFLKAARELVVTQLGELGITIESNPSSNLIIGDFDSLAEHPTLSMHPWKLAEQAQLPISINTDDPLTFASKLADEYAYMDFALREQGVGVRESLAWLDSAREAGWASRFTLPGSSDLQLLEKLLSSTR